MAAAAGCVYFNALYNANRLFDQGLREIREGREASGRATVGSGLEKAQRIVAENPDSRWADDAQRLVVRARLLREEWQEALSASDALLRYAGSRADSAEVSGYRGMAHLNLGRPALADSLLTVALAEAQARERRAETLHQRGKARTALGRVEAADEDLRAASGLQPSWAAPRLDRFRLRSEAGPGAQAALELDSLSNLRLGEGQERAVVEAAREAAARSPGIAAAALARAESTRLSRTSKAELVKLRAELKVAAGDVEGGLADYELVAAILPGTRIAVDARLSILRERMKRVRDLEQLGALRTSVDSLAAVPAARGNAEFNRLADTFVRMEYWQARGGLGLWQAAETARDQLDAPLLARHLFLTYVDAQPEALWAPKAILAVVDLAPLDSGDRSNPAIGESELEGFRKRLREDYADSPYVQALAGGPGGRYSFEELELALRRQLQRLQTLADQEVQRRRTPRGQP